MPGGGGCPNLEGSRSGWHDLAHCLYSIVYQLGFMWDHRVLVSLMFASKAIYEALVQHASVLGTLMTYFRQSKL